MTQLRRAPLYVRREGGALDPEHGEVGDGCGSLSQPIRSASRRVGGRHGDHGLVPCRLALVTKSGRGRRRGPRRGREDGPLTSNAAIRSPLERPWEC